MLSKLIEEIVTDIFWMFILAASLYGILLTINNIGILARILINYF
jgi:hypothetical protein